MNEVKKLYKTAGLSTMLVEDTDRKFWRGCYQEILQSIMKITKCSKKEAQSVVCNENKKTLPFTEEKQLQLIKVLTNQCDLTISHLGTWEFVHFDGLEQIKVKNKSFEEALAKLINKFWQELSEAEKEQIKGILEN